MEIDVEYTKRNKASKKITSLISLNYIIYKKKQQPGWLLGN